MQGQPVIILQAEEILDCLYDLLLQHFTCIHTPSGDLHYVNVINEGSIHPTRISPTFKCGVVVNSSEISKIPLSILNGLEKHTLSHKDFLDAILSCCPGSVQKLLQYAKYEVSPLTFLEINHKFSYFVILVHLTTLQSIYVVKQESPQYYINLFSIVIIFLLDCNIC